MYILMYIIITHLKPKHWYYIDRQTDIICTYESDIDAEKEKKHNKGEGMMT